MRRSRRTAKHLTSVISWRDRGPFLGLCLLLALAFFMGGASRGDVSSLAILRPAAILLLGYGLWGLKWAQVKAYRYLFGLAAAMIVITLIQLVPLPPALWSRLPGREFIVEIDRAARLGAVWRPISLVPAATWNGFYAMMVPLGVLVLGARLSPDESGKLLPVLVAGGLISALLALLQVIGPPDGPLYFYRVTNPGAAVGLFANRNHQAVLLAALFPMLAVFASLSRHSGGQPGRRAIAIGIGMFAVPLIFITGSRFGLVGAVIGIASALLLYRPHMKDSAGKGRSATSEVGPAEDRRHRPPPKAWHRRGIVALVAALGIGLSLITIMLGRAEAFQRILQEDGSNEFRFKAWGPVTKMVGEYFPFGSGLGSFVEVYQIHEPRSLLDSEYFNHAHNDWLEVLLTGGFAALVLLTLACGLVVARFVQLIRRAGRQPRRDELFARLGLVLIVQFAIASAADYPLRTPALASLFVLAALWAAAPLRRSGLAVDARGGLPHGS